MTTKKTAAMTTKASVKKLSVKKSPVPAKPATKTAGKSGAKTAPQKAIKKSKKEHKKKVVRDSFTMPQSEYEKIAEIKATLLNAKIRIKKSEVLRAGLKLLAELNDAQLKRTLGSLEKIKTGRPQKH
jgi:hypothetical protein